MRILIDADGCPVVDEAVHLSKEKKLECLILCDTAHEISRSHAQTLTFSKGADSVDFALVNLLRPGDIVITQDYGLAAMCLAKGAFILHQDGMEYTKQNIDSLLLARHTAREIRRAGGRHRGNAKRTKMQNRQFSAALRALIERLENQ